MIIYLNFFFLFRFPIILKNHCHMIASLIPCFHDLTFEPLNASYIFDLTKDRYMQLFYLHVHSTTSSLTHSHSNGMREAGMSSIFRYFDIWTGEAVD